MHCKGVRLDGWGTVASGSHTCPDMCQPMSTLMAWTSNHEPLVLRVASTDAGLPRGAGMVVGLPGVVGMVVGAILPTLIWQGTIILVGAKVV
jgi:hypothetical protein